MQDHFKAAEDFRRARNRAVFQDLLARLTGQPAELLSYEEVRQKLRTSGVASQSIQEVPLKDIVGSVGRYTDFTRSFLPRRTSDQDRWVKIMVALDDLSGLPPVDLYLIDEVYFVSDGHHRVSVAKEIGADTIQAYVTEIRSDIPLAVDASREDLILKAEYADFLKRTQIAVLRPEADLSVSIAGQYGKLLEHIYVHRYFMGIDLGREVPFYEAVSRWYDIVYMPIIHIVRDLCILDDFPERTEADLYLWISKHRADIADVIDWDVDYTAAAADIVEQKGPRWRRLVARVGQRVIDVVSANGESAIPRSEELLDKRHASLKRLLFNDILVPISGQEVGWIALDQALTVAERENGRIMGIHVQPEDEEHEESRTGAIKEGFYWRCGETDVQGKLTFAKGQIAKTVCQRARWVDLVVVKLQYPPGSSAVARFSSGMAKMIRDCTKPILVVAGESPSLDKPLLLWQDKRRSNLALMIAAYVAGQWELPLVVLSADDNGANAGQNMAALHEYLSQYDFEATFASGDIGSAEKILSIVNEHNCDWIISAGYGGGSLREIVLEPALDELLRKSTVPILISK